MSSLVREKPELESPDRKLTNVRSGFADECCKVLGYYRLKDDTKGEVALGTDEDRLNSKAEKLLQVLHDMGIDPFTPQSVAAYKDDKATSPGQKLCNYMDQQVFPWLANVALIGFVWLVVGAICWGFLGLGTLWGLQLPAGLFGGSVVTLIVLFAAADIYNKCWIEGSWVLTPLPGYYGKVPVDALQLALDLKQKLPNLGIYIDVLTPPAKRDTTLPHSADPFLVVGYNNGRGGESRVERLYYVAVWDEPTYKPIKIV